MGLFGKSESSSPATPAVPVFTVQTLSRNYEPLTTVTAQQNIVNTASKNAYDKIIHDLGAQAATIGADAVIGLLFHNQVATSVTAFGTAIKYID